MIPFKLCLPFLPDEGGRVKVFKSTGRSYYNGSSVNGVTSQAFRDYHASMSFQGHVRTVFHAAYVTKPEELSCFVKERKYFL